MGDKAWYEKVLDGLKAILEYLGSDKGQKLIELVLKLVLLGCGVSEKYNAPLSGAEKLQNVRNIVRFVRYASSEEIDEMAYLMLALKGDGNIDRLEPWELDKIMGDGVALWMRGQAEQVKTGGQGGPGSEGVVEF